MTTTRTETVTAADGGTFQAHLTIPSTSHHGAVLLIQEIFGVNDYVRSVGERLAELGHVSLAPDVFWRVEPGFELDSSTPDNIEPAMAVASQWDPEVGLADLTAAFEHLQGLDDTFGPTAVMGFCFGGTQAIRLAQHLDPACAVSYYGSGVVDLLDDIDRLTCPTLLHFGDSDPFIPNEQVDAIRAAAADRHHITVHVHQGGGHAFDNHLAPHFSNPALAAEAWTQTAAFLVMHLGSPGMGA